MPASAIPLRTEHSPGAGGSRAVNVLREGYSGLLPAASPSFAARSDAVSG